MKHFFVFDHFREKIMKDNKNLKKIKGKAREGFAMAPNES